MILKRQACVPVALEKVLSLLFFGHLAIVFRHVFVVRCRLDCFVVGGAGLLFLGRGLLYGLVMGLSAVVGWFGFHGSLSSGSCCRLCHWFAVFALRCVEVGGRGTGDSVLLDRG